MRTRVAADAVAVLSRALISSAAADRLHVEVACSRSRPWSSATFTGERVALTLHVELEARAWLMGLTEADLPMRGWFVADLTTKEAGIDVVMVDALLLLDA